MKKIYSLMIGLLLVGGAFAATKSAVIKFATVAPEMDGFAEEAWDIAVPEAIDQFLYTETPTVTATWQALYDEDNFYVVVSVNDDDHYPAWASGGNAWEFDKPEVYWDVNEVLLDGGGPVTASSGHYQLSPGMTEDGYDAVQTAAATTQSPGGSYSYSQVGEGYVYEMAVPWANFLDKNAVVETAAIAKTRAMGFDVCVIDQDEGVTTARQRKTWAQDGKTPVADESWNNMDGAGTITFEGGNGVNTLKTRTMSVYPNPAIDNVTINADFNRVAISNILGQQIKSFAVTSKTVNVSDLSKGVYVIKAYKNDKYVGTAKVTKN
jgi:hypothetical protein